MDPPHQHEGVDGAALGKRNMGLQGGNGGHDEHGQVSWKASGCRLQEKQYRVLRVEPDPWSEAGRF
jgi:hypothetical protein